MRLIQMLVDYFDAGLPKYTAGSFYAPAPELEACVPQGYAVAVEVPDDADVVKALAAADRKTEALERAADAAIEANRMADATVAAVAIAAAAEEVPPAPVDGAVQTSAAAA